MVRLRGAAWVFVSQVTSLVLAVPISVLFARALGPSGKGTVTVAQLIGGVGAMILGVGLPGAITHLAARREVDGAGVVRLAWLWAAGASAVLLAAVAVGGTWLADALFDSAGVRYMVLGCLSVLPLLVTGLNGGYLLGRGRLKQYSLLNISVLGVQLVIFFALWALERLTPATAVGAWLVVVTGGALASTIMIGAERDAGAIRSPRSIVARGWRFGVASWLASGLGMLSLRVDMFLVSGMAGAAAVGVYSISVTFAEIAWYLPNALYTTLFPKISAEGAERAEVVARVNRALWPVTLAFALFMALASVWLIPLLFGAEFAGAVAPVWLLAPGIAASAAGIIPGAYLAGIGKPQAGAVSSLVNVVANVALNVVLIPAYGVPGAAIASTLSYAVGAAVMVVLFRRETGIGLRQTLVPSLSDFAGFWNATVGAVRGLAGR